VTDTTTVVLGHRHNSILELFDQLWRPDSDHIGLLSDLIAAVASHVAVERTFLYPILAGDKHGRRLAVEAGEVVPGE
jgi:hypothetical protein